MSRDFLSNDAEGGSGHPGIGKSLHNRLNGLNGLEWGGMAVSRCEN